jgi:uncharacterized protein YndB with AHSA1/START domain
MADDTRIDTAARLIRAPASRIFQAFASPEAMERWLPPAGMTGRMLEFDFRDGGAYRMRLTYTRPGHGRGKTSDDADEVAVRLIKLVTNRRIEQSVAFESEDPTFSGEMRVTWSLDPVEQGTLVSVRCEDIPAGISADDHKAGLESTLRNLSAFVEIAPV